MQFISFSLFCFCYDKNYFNSFFCRQNFSVKTFWRENWKKQRKKWLISIKIKTGKSQKEPIFEEEKKKFCDVDLCDHCGRLHLEGRLKPLRAKIDIW